MGTLDERTSIRWLGGFGGMLPQGHFWNLSLLNGWKCIRNVSNVTPAVKSRNFHDTTAPKGANYLKMAPHKLPVSGKWPPPPPPPPAKLPPPTHTQVINYQPLKAPAPIYQLYNRNTIFSSIIIIQGEAGIFLVSSCYSNWNKLQALAQIQIYTYFGE